MAFDDEENSDDADADGEFDDEYDSEDGDGEDDDYYDQENDGYGVAAEDSEDGDDQDIICEGFLCNLWAASSKAAAIDIDSLDVPECMADDDSDGDCSPAAQGGADDSGAGTANSDSSAYDVDSLWCKLWSSDYCAGELAAATQEGKNDGSYPQQQAFDTFVENGSNEEDEDNDDVEYDDEMEDLDDYYEDYYDVEDVDAEDSSLDGGTEDSREH